LLAVGGGAENGHDDEEENDDEDEEEEEEEEVEEEEVERRRAGKVSLRSSAKANAAISEKLFRALEELTLAGHAARTAAHDAAAAGAAAPAHGGEERGLGLIALLGTLQRVVMALHASAGANAQAVAMQRPGLVSVKTLSTVAVPVLRCLFRITADAVLWRDGYPDDALAALVGALAVVPPLTEALALPDTPAAGGGGGGGGSGAGEVFHLWGEDFATALLSVVRSTLRDPFLAPLPFPSSQPLSRFHLAHTEAPTLPHPHTPRVRACQVRRTPADRAGTAAAVALQRCVLGLFTRPAPTPTPTPTPAQGVGKSRAKAPTSYYHRSALSTRFLLLDVFYHTPLATTTTTDTTTTTTTSTTVAAVTTSEALKALAAELASGGVGLDEQAYFLRVAYERREDLGAGAFVDLLFAFLKQGLAARTGVSSFSSSSSSSSAGAGAATGAAALPAASAAVVRDPAALRLLADLAPSATTTSTAAARTPKAAASSSSAASRGVGAAGGRGGVRALADEVADVLAWCSSAEVRLCL